VLITRSCLCVQIHFVTNACNAQKDITVLEKEVLCSVQTDKDRFFSFSPQERRFRGYVLSLSPFFLELYGYVTTPLYLFHLFFYTPPKCPGREKKMFVCVFNVCLTSEADGTKNAGKRGGSIQA